MTGTPVEDGLLADHDGGGRSARKRRAILDAATDVFLRDGYAGTSMDTIATVSGVSKQTVYKQFSSKEALFVEIVTRLTWDAGDVVHAAMPELGDDDDLEGYLVALARGQLEVVLTPRLMQLRRLVIGEVSHFPELAAVLYEGGPKRAMGTLEAVFERLGGAWPPVDRRAGGRGIPVQLAGDGRAIEPGDAARRRGDPVDGGAPADR